MRFAQWNKNSKWFGWFVLEKRDRLFHMGLVTGKVIGFGRCCEKRIITRVGGRVWDFIKFTDKISARLASSAYRGVIP